MVDSNFDLNTLQFLPGSADRFSYSCLFVPRVLSAVPFYRAKFFNQTQAIVVGDILRPVGIYEAALKVFKDTEGPGVENPEVSSQHGGNNPFLHYLEKNRYIIDAEAMLKQFAAPEVQEAVQLASHLTSDQASLKQFQHLASLIDSRPVREVLNLTGEAVTSLKQSGTAVSSATGPVTHVDTTNPEEVRDTIQFLLDILRSDLGFVFYDRTRIHPAGFAVGDHLFSLSLAPGEEVTLEQKNWTKREISLEELLERERELDLELSSTVATELEEGLDHTYKTQQSLGGSYTGAASATIPIGDVPIGVSSSLSYQANISDADETTRRDSVKNTFTRSSKIAAKYRALHKITFKISTEAGFESLSRRIVKNPNKGTPIDLHYFKIQQVFDLTQERYGAKLCWAPSIADPGKRIRERAEKIAAEKAKVTAVEVVKPLEPEPPKPASKDQEFSSWGPPVDLNNEFKFDGYMYTDKTAECDIPPGYDWDRVNSELLLNFSGERGHKVSANGKPWREGHIVKVSFHVWIECTKKGLGIFNNIISGGCSWNEDQGTANVQFRVRLVPVTTTDEEAAFAKYQAAHIAWEQEVAKLTQEAKQKEEELRAAALQEAGLAEQKELQVDPLPELLHRLIASYFTSKIPTDYWQVEFWHRLFDWESASYTLYPGWWTGSDLNYPDRSPVDFLNASWARLYLPIRPGYELGALRWIMDKQLDIPLEPRIEAELKAIVAELEDHRTQHFGAADELTFAESSSGVQEKFDVLGCWQEQLPTDGTHLEVVLAKSTALDALTQEQLSEESGLRDAAIQSQNEDANLKKSISKHLTAGTSPQVNVIVNGHEYEGTAPFTH